MASKNDIKTTENNLGTQMESILAELKAEIANAKASTIKWVAGMLVAQTALFAALVKLL